MTYKEKIKILGACAVQLHEKGAPTSYKHGHYTVAINHKRRMKRLMNATGLPPIAAANLYIQRNTKPKTENGKP
jgi:hypothetical protein